MGIYATWLMGNKVVMTAEEKLKSDLALGREIIEQKYPGDWQIIGGKLYKGNVLMEGNYQIVDRIGKLTGGTVTIFKGDTRVATNVMRDNHRMVNTKAADYVVEKVLKNGKTYLGQADVVGVKCFTTYEPIKDKNGQIIGMWYVGLPATPYDEMVAKFRLNMIGYSALGIIAGFIAAFLIAYTVYMPLRRIGDAVAKTSEGDLTQRIPVKADDALGRLAVKVNVMIERMYDLIGKTKNLSATVKDSSSQLLERSNLSASLTEKMVNEANTMSSNTQEQAQLTEKSRRAITEMSSAIEQLAANTQEVSTSAMTATDKAKEGEKQIKDAINQINIIKEAVNSAAGVIEGLGKKSQEIGQIVDLITSIAAQTNLLALNAAIEAARAGEQGKGFAVVAEEVRKLAEESGEAAKKIAELINEIQSEAQSAVHSMQEGTREVNNGSEIILAAGEFFNQIINAVSAVNEQIQEISAASEEIAASAETAIISIEETTRTAENNARAAEKISQIAEEQMAGIEEVNATINRLNDIVNALEEAMSYFKI
ncbi:MAG: methyl-accepting chemotaxis protein [Thermosyntropha sp.]|nr:methyl-accepting chemotaxis protein [Thermosyntropha sp.]